MGGLRIGPDDPRYRAVIKRQFNKRFTASPDYIRLVSSTEEVVGAVAEAISEGRRLAVTSGGHCLEGFVSDPSVRALLDVSPMNRVYYDHAMRAVAVESGATVGETFRALYDSWRVVVPLGESPKVGIGGHVAGGAFGFLCRQLGLAADYLHAVEVVTVDQTGRAAPVVATRDPSDPNRELWWAHTGAGGGNFGVVTRYWFRSPSATGDNPAAFLPRAPESITTFRAEWSLDDIDQASFLRLLQNHGTWCETNSDADAPNASLWTLLTVHRRPFAKIIVRGVSTDMAWTAGWLEPRDEAAHVQWVRTFYRDLFADGGGVPVPGAAYGGALINHPDVDLRDPAWNTSDVPWQTLYYRNNYARLQQVKAQWDPRDVFHHALSIGGRTS